MALYRIVGFAFTRRRLGRLKMTSPSGSNGSGWAHRLRHAGLMLIAAVICAGCASLPDHVERASSTAIAASLDTTLGRIAAISSPDPTLSGFRLLPSGAFALNTRIELARRAERSLDLQYFLLRNDATGRDMLRALRDAARRGVRVRLLLDDLYTAGQDKMLLELALDANIEVRLFNPFPAGRSSQGMRLAASLFNLHRVNHRMHNKLFIADGVMAVTGGRNIADEYFTRHPLDNFIDLDVFVSGATVPELAKLFDLYWNSASAYPVQSIASANEENGRKSDDMTTPPEGESGAPGDLPSSDVLGYGPISEELDEGRLGLIWGHADVFADPPTKGFDSGAPLSGVRREDSGPVRFSVLEHIRDAKAEVFLISPYLIPGSKGMNVIRNARTRGVSIGMLTNSLASTDQPLVHAGYRRYRRELLSLGVNLYELSPLNAGRKSRQVLFGASVSGLHTKAIVFDQQELFIGSMNFDPRSEHYNTEMGLMIHSAAVAREALQLARSARLLAAHRLRLTASGAIEWLSPDDSENPMHTEEPEAGFWNRVLLELLAPLAPEELL